MGYTAKELALHRVKASKWLKGEAAEREREEGQGKEEEEDGGVVGEGQWGEAGGAAVVRKKRKTGVGSVGWE